MPIVRGYRRAIGTPALSVRVSAMTKLALGETVTALLGDLSTPPRLEVTPRQVYGDNTHLGKYYVRLPSGDADSNDASTYSVVREALNLAANLPDNAAGIPVLVKQRSKTDSRLVIVAPDVATIHDNNIETLSFNLASRNMLLKPTRDLTALRVSAYGDRDNASTSIFVPDAHALAFFYSGTWRILDSAYTVDLSSAIPIAGKERLVFVHYDADADALDFTQGTVRDITSAKWTASDFNDASSGITANILPAAFYRLANNEQNITENNRVIDARQWLTTNNPSIVGGLTPALNAKTVTKTANYTIVASDGLVLVDCSGGDVTITLPSAVGLSGRQFNIKVTDVSGGVCTIDANGTQTIDGQLTQELNTQYDAISIMSDNANWWIV